MTASSRIARDAVAPNFGLGSGLGAIGMIADKDEEGDGTDVDVDADAGAEPCADVGAFGLGFA